MRPSAHEVLGIAVGLTSVKSLKDGDDRAGWRSLARNLVSALNRDHNARRSQSILKKLSLMFGVLPSFQGIGQLTQFMAEERLPRPTSDFALWALSDPKLDVWHNAVKLSNFQPVFISNTEGRNQLFSFNEKWNIEKVPISIQALLNAINAFANNDYLTCLSEIVSVEAGLPSQFFEVEAQLLKLNCEVALADTQNAIDTHVKLAMRFPNVLPSLPTKHVLPSNNWSALKHLASNINMPIHAHFRHVDTGEQNDYSLKRKAVQKYLESYGAKLPSQLQIEETENTLSRYFLEMVCTADILDLLDGVESPSKALLEREQILNNLKKSFPDNADFYYEELEAIQDRRTIEDGIRAVDSSRIHVELNGIRSWAEKELSLGFDRFKELLKVEGNTAPPFDEVLRAILRQEDIGSQLFSFPASEVDALLISLISAIRDRFLLDPSFGLDSYLSKRIRHVSLPGSLRSHVEESNLVTQRATEKSEYQKNTYWPAKLTSLNQSQATEVVDALKFLSHCFDEEILKITRKYFHVQSTDKPEGLFEIPISTQTYRLIRSAIDENSSFFEFFDACVAIYWAILEQSLDRARKYLTVTCSSNLHTAFNKTKNLLKKAAANDPNYAALSLAMSDATAKTEQELTLLSLWLRRVESELTKHLFTLGKALDCAIASAMGAHRSVNPSITTEVSGDCYVQVNTVVVLADVMRVALGNAVTHSGLVNPPKVSICLSIDEKNEVMELKVASEVSSNAVSDQAQIKLEAIREAIRQNQISQFERKEGGSGLLKLASLVKQSTSGRIAFQLSESHGFELNLALSFIPPKRTD